MENTEFIAKVRMLDLQWLPLKPAEALNMVRVIYRDHHIIACGELVQKPACCMIGSGLLWVHMRGPDGENEYQSIWYDTGDELCSYQHRVMKDGHWSEWTLSPTIGCRLGQPPLLSPVLEEEVAYDAAA